MTDVHQRLRRLGLTLPAPTPTVFAYAPAILYGHTVHVAGQIPKTRIDTLLVEGIVGENVSAAMGRDAVKLCVLHALAWVAHLSGGLHAVAQILRVRYFFQVGDTPNDLSPLADAGSELLIALFDDRGRHPRSVIGVSALPRNAPVLVELDAALTSDFRPTGSTAHAADAPPAHPATSDR